MLEVAHGHPRRALSLRARDGEEGAVGGRVVPELSFPLKINPPGLQIAGCLTCGQLPRARISPPLTFASFNERWTAVARTRERDEGGDGREEKPEALAFALTATRTGTDGRRVQPESAPVRAPWHDRNLFQLTS